MTGSAPLAAAVAAFGTMAVEAVVSARHERVLRAAGAQEPPDDPYVWMQVVYPGGFAAVCVEGWVRGAAWSGVALAGVAIFAAGKAIKYAAMLTLGPRWSFRVLTLPGAPLVTHGVYRYLRHPNYLGLAGEILGIAAWLQAPIAGTLFAVTFGLILRRRILVEERALASARQA